MTYDSISDFLLVRGFTCLQGVEGCYFYRLGLRIRAAELAGHTVGSFAKQYGLDREPQWPAVKTVAGYHDGKIVQDQELEEALKK